ncbi:50S ribosomal protein L11 methyltransferase [Thermodesulfobacteriota bacterium]
MNATGDRHLDQNKSTAAPYDTLYIYYLRGCLKPNYGIADNHFIGTWEEDGFSFLFFSRPSHKKVDILLQKQTQLALIDDYRITYDDWHGGKIIPYTSGSFLISPPWEKCDTGTSRHHILLDPGVVFGTGAHTTTKDCLEAIELAFDEHRIESTIDLGTGTGLLALAAARLGCKQTLAVDLNFLAVKTAMKNIFLNRLENKMLAVQGRAEEFIDCHSDLVIANIHHDVMKHLVNSKGFLGKRQFVLSGLLRSQTRDVMDILSMHPVEIIKKWEGDGVWHTLYGRVC